MDLARSGARRVDSAWARARAARPATGRVIAVLLGFGDASAALLTWSHALATARDLNATPVTTVVQCVFAIARRR
jgi:hypothetical protein